jgi:hypothetical protein
MMRRGWQPLAALALVSLLAACEWSPGASERKARAAARHGAPWFAARAGACASQPGASPTCYYSIGATRYCGGAAPPAQVLADYGKDVCVCNECAEDADCGVQSRGKCKRISTRSCEGQAEMRCVYPDDPCFVDTCPAGTVCLLDRQGPEGRAACRQPEPARP